MKSDRTLFLLEAALLISVQTPLAYSASEWWYWLLTVAVVLIGWLTTVRQDRPVVGPVMGRVGVVVAFAFLTVEYFFVAFVPIMALAHFMTLVCFTKLLQRRTLRDHTQIIVLALLMLVIASIVSDHIVLFIALIVHGTAGLAAIIVFHIEVERARTLDRNSRIGSLTPAAPESDRHHGWAVWRMATSTAAFAIVFGIAFFVLFPRVGAGMFGAPSFRRHIGPAMTGFSTALNFQSIGPIRESSEAIMRVEIADTTGEPIDFTQPFYFRGTVLGQYIQGEAEAGGRWHWRRFGTDQESDRKPQVLRPEYEDEPIEIQTPAELGGAAMIEQRFWLERSDHAHLFTCYPPIEIESPDFDAIRVWPADQVVQLRRSSRRPFRYTTRSLRDMTPESAEILQRFRASLGVDAPRVFQPDPALPREAELRALIQDVAGDPPPADDGDAQLQYVDAMVAYLQSESFAYTLNPPIVRADMEPVGEFILDGRAGHCEYFASALVVMCQLSGLPARVVNGYRSGEYNAVGGFFVVREKDAHAWAEVYIPGRDWVTFDPTPAAEAGEGGIAAWLLTLRSVVDYLQFQWADQVVEYDTGHREELASRFEQWVKRPVRDERTLFGAIGAFVRELFGWRLKLTSQERLIYWVFAILATTLVLLVGYVVTTLTWRIGRTLWRLLGPDKSQRRSPPDAVFYNRLCKQLERLGWRRQPEQTPAEFIEAVVDQHPAWAPARQVVASYYAVMFGEQRLSDDQKQRFASFLDQLERSVGQSPVERFRFGT